jgi:hypothetical protein
MDKGNLEAEHAAARRLVDQLRSRLRKMRERSAEVVDLVGDVMHSRPSLREKTADRSVVVERTEQLEPALADPDRGRLDALILDTRAPLELRSEQALVGVESAVQILDGEPDVMHRAGRVHCPIVCERLATPMRAPALALIVTAALLAGCGSSHRSAAKANGVASKSATQVLAAAKTAVASASSVHVSGSIVSGGTPITVDLSMATGKGAKGSMTTSGLAFDIVAVGDVAYIKGSDEFLKHFAGAAFAQLLHGKWLKASTKSGRFAQLAPLTNINVLFGDVASHHGKLANDGVKTYKGQKAVLIRDTSDNSKLYVAATGKPYPVALMSGKAGQSGTVTFDDWNKPVSLSAPSGAYDISKLGG